MSMRVADATSRVSLDTLRELAPGTGYVESISAEADLTLVRLAYPFGRNIDVAVPELPAAAGPKAPTAVRRPLAVQVRNGSDTIECSVLGSSASGPQRFPITMTQALALAGSGVHTVFLSE